jgi:hypothetical protein
MNAVVIGWIVLALPALLIGGLILIRWRVAQWIYVVALIAGLAYLTRIGTVGDVGVRASAYLPKVMVHT